jgi:hypothetical protein
MESSTHYIMAVTSEDSNNTPILPIPKPHRLVITARNNPRQFLVELDCSDVVEMTRERENALLGLVVPNFDFVIVTTTDEHWLRLMEVNTSDRTYIMKKKDMSFINPFTYHRDPRISLGGLAPCSRKDLWSRCGGRPGSRACTCGTISLLPS